MVLGGGYVGLEFAQAYRRFGSRVTVVQRGPQLLDREDPDVADAIRQLFSDEGIEVLRFGRSDPGRGAVRGERASGRADAAR
jgi:pyruvate/2-oxoglutarate dehydrogenase complex dihydrolipoamide dehydrogenase (E3) component